MFDNSGGSPSHEDPGALEDWILHSPNSALQGLSFRLGKDKTLRSKMTVSRNSFAIPKFEDSLCGNKEARVICLTVCFAALGSLSVLDSYLMHVQTALRKKF